MLQGENVGSLVLCTTALRESLLQEKMPLTAGLLSAGERDQGEFANASHLVSLGLGSSMPCGYLDPRTLTVLLSQRGSTHPLTPLYQL